jgi:hypothetical protein
VGISQYAYFKGALQNGPLGVLMIKACDIFQQKFPAMQCANSNCIILFSACLSSSNSRNPFIQFSFNFLFPAELFLFWHRRLLNDLKSFHLSTTSRGTGNIKNDEKNQLKSQNSQNEEKIAILSAAGLQNLALKIYLTKSKNMLF